MKFIDPSKPHPSQTGAVAELIAAAWLIRQGFQVFRNLCPTGPIDIVAVDDAGSSHFFDVKAWDHDINDKTKWRAVSPEQALLGVRLIKVNVKEGECAFQEETRTKGELTDASCAHCGNSFRYERKNLERKFCHAKCAKSFHWAVRKGKIAA